MVFALLLSIGARADDGPALSLSFSNGANEVELSFTATNGTAYQIESATTLTNFTAMWTTDARGVAGVVNTVMWFFSGMLLPPEFLPRWLRVLVWWLPFQAQIYAPTTIYMGHVGGGRTGQLLALQAFWTLILIGAGKAVLAAGQRKLTIQGG